MMENGFVVWFTGLPGSGKSTLANLLVDKLRNGGFPAELLDGGAWRKDLNPDLGFSKEERDMHVRQLGRVAHLLSRNGITAVVAAVSPHDAARKANRQDIDRYVEVYLKCPVEICEKRESEGLYAEARAGKISEFTGVSGPYEEPTQPDVEVETDSLPAEEALQQVVQKLVERGYLPADWLQATSDEYSEEEEEMVKKRLSDLGYM